MALKPISTAVGARKLLQRLIDAKRCVLEDFDAPPPGHINPGMYRNLLRDPVDDADPKIEVVNPRDFVPAEENALPY